MPEHPSTQVRRVPWLVGSRWGLLLAFTVTIAVPLAIFAFLVLHEVHDALERQALEREALSARYAALVLQEHVAGSLRYLAGEAGSPDLAAAMASHDRNALDTALRGMIFEQTRFDRAFVTDAKGVLREDFPAVPEVEGRDFSQRDWFRGVSRTKEPYVSNFYTRMAAPAHGVVAFAAPIRDPRGRVLGYLVLQERIGPLLGTIDHREATRTLAIVDRRGSAVSSRDGQHDVGHDPLVRRGLAGGSGSGVGAVPFQRGTSLYAYAPVPSTGWSVFAYESEGNALVAVRSLSDTLAWLAVAALAGMLLLGAYWLYAVNRYQANLVAVEHELRRSRDELEGVSYSLSHDLRTPLRGIDGFSQLLLEDYGPQLDATGQSYLQRVRQASQRMGRLLDDFVRLLSVSRAEIAREPVDLSALGHEVAAQLQQSMPARPVEWAIQDGLEVKGDVRLLRLVLEDLFNNAWKFTRGRAPARIALTGESLDHELSVCVEDNGIGFEMAYVDKLFKPFQKLHAPEQEYEGSGMGLAIVQRIIERHGGRVWACGTPDQGARFCFSLPRGTGTVSED
ncbi:MAG TPA: ATP-binding protein [Oscillatoriaceae cyanobacterium]